MYLHNHLKQINISYAVAKSTSYEPMKFSHFKQVHIAYLVVIDIFKSQYIKFPVILNIKGKY